MLKYNRLEFLYQSVSKILSSVFLICNQCHCLIIESKLTLLATQEANESKGQGIEATNLTLFGKPAH